MSLPPLEDEFRARGFLSLDPETGLTLLSLENKDVVRYAQMA